MKSNPAQIDDVLEELQDATKTWLEKECREK
jgi:hypothetical protein